MHFLNLMGFEMDIPVNSTFLLPLDDWKHAVLHIVGRQDYLCRYRWCVIGITPVLLEVEIHLADFDIETKTWVALCRIEHFGIGAIHKIDPLKEDEFERLLLEQQTRIRQQNRENSDDIPF